LSASQLEGVDVVIDFTTPAAVVTNIEACVRAKKNMVVGTTGWHGDVARVRQMVEQGGTGFLYAANFSVGINLFFDAARTAAAALQHGYFGQIFERHHAQKKDAPSGTAVALQKVVKEASSIELEITSFREGDVVGMHELVLDSPNDTIYLCHDAKSRRGFAEGAVRAAEWLAGKKGFFDFKDVWRGM
jgi:4-hydroxy-tetrahydrodipicolinate reductase